MHVRRRQRASALLGGAVLTVALLTGCGQGLLFREAVTITLVNPTEDSVQPLPLTVRWKPVGDGAPPAQYGVFIDTNPPPPGERIDQDQLDAEVKRVFVTTSLEQVVQEITQNSTPIEAEKDKHEVTVVGLDADGRRIDESSASTTFQVTR